MFRVAPRENRVKQLIYPAVEFVQPSFGELPQEHPVDSTRWQPMEPWLAASGYERAVRTGVLQVTVVAHKRRKSTTKQRIQLSKHLARGLCQICSNMFDTLDCFAYQKEVVLMVKVASNIKQESLAGVCNQPPTMFT